MKEVDLTIVFPSSRENIRLAMGAAAGYGRRFVLRDHIGSTSHPFTGQREDATIGLYFYNARYYDAALGRFPQPDTIVPEPGNPGSLNRYSYANNSPIVYNDPTGHCPTCIGAFVGGLLGGGAYLLNEMRQPGGIDLHMNISFNNGLKIDVGEDWGDLLVATGEGAVAGALIATPGGQAAGISMAASLISDHIENQVTGEDFSASEHLIEGGFGAVSGGTGKLVLAGVASKTALAAGTVSDDLMIGSAALNSGFWGGVKGGVNAAMQDDNIGKGILSGAGTGVLSGAWSKAAGLSTVVGGGEVAKSIVTIGQKVTIKNLLSVPKWISDTLQQSQVEYK